jgi:glycosyltransferase involved in cell wall biosynthesis
MYHSNLAASVARWVLRRRVPVVWSVHYTLAQLASERRLTAFIIRLCGRISRSADAIIYVSRTSQHQHAALGYCNAKSCVLPNGVNGHEFQPSAAARRAVREELGLPPETPLVGHIGRFHPMKDHENFLRAARLVAHHRPDARFLMAGRGVDEENRVLRQLLTELDLQPRVHLLGERHDIPRLAAALDVFALSSAYGESFPNIIGEAMACGVPCVVTEVGDAAWIVGDTGAVVPPQDAPALAEKCLDALALTPATRLATGQRARQRVRENFALEAVAQRYLQLYQSLVGRQKESG